jgi:hypothetical protein
VFASYNGDVVDRIFPAHGQTKGAVGLDLTYEYNDHINIRGGYTYARVSGMINLIKVKNCKSAI